MHLYWEVPWGSISLVRALITSLDKYRTVKVEFSPSPVKSTFAFTIFPPKELQKQAALVLEQKAYGARQWDLLD